MFASEIFRVINVCFMYNSKLSKTQTKGHLSQCFISFNNVFLTQTEKLCFHLCPLQRFTQSCQNYTKTLTKEAASKHLKAHLTHRVFCLFFGTLCWSLHSFGLWPSENLSVIKKYKIHWKWKVSINRKTAKSPEMINCYIQFKRLCNFSCF